MVSSADAGDDDTDGGDDSCDREEDAQTASNKMTAKAPLLIVSADAADAGDQSDW